MSLVKIQNQVHNQYLKLQKLDRFIRSMQFVVAYQKASKDNQILMEHFINHSELKKLKNLTNLILMRKSPSLLSIGDLRCLGRKYGIRNYYNMFKDQLVFEIERLQNDINTSKKISK